VNDAIAEEALASEAGRKLFSRPCRFLRAVAKTDGLPPIGAPELAFIGRSNVGKSSLINALTGRSGLARASNTPGRTQELIFFDLDGVLTLVDMPGYGYAEAPKAKVKAWQALARNYLRGRPNLLRALLLVDARHGLKDNDLETMTALDAAAVSYAVTLTKVDAVKAGERGGRIDETAKALAKRPAAFPRVFATSAREGLGVDDLRGAVATWLRDIGAPREGA